ncbi:hypothetical protein BKA66DRAFT_407536 [Pyrenochaeta sp. MPI-SDFR-AT-0127]|nr:hypothetical protein BKA66DRAFT_407536 [Pyrenochaeta sp. MPI-SDFR-AT-0127]
MSLQEDSPVPHVCVVGAGMAGLSCARILLSHGFKIAIIEARDRIGGRQCVRLPPRYVCRPSLSSLPSNPSLARGPNWIYTSIGENQPIMKLAKQTNTPIHVWNDDIRLFNSDGNPVEPAKALRLQELIWTFFEDSFTYSVEHGSEIPTSASLYQYVRKRIAECAVSDDDRELLAGLSQMWGNYTGDAIQRQSLKYCWTEIVRDGDEYFVTSDFASILAKAAEGLQQIADIQLGTRATHFRSRVRLNQEMAGVEISTSDGEPQRFDEVVITCPLGWLKINKHAFEPPLESRLLESIDAISVGHLEKVYITFPKAFWRLDVGQDGKSLDHIIWLSPQYTPDTNPFHWPLEAYDLAAFGAKTSHPTLLVYTFGDLSAHISSIVHCHPDKETQYAHLDRFFQPYYCRLPHFDAKDADCRPKGYLASAWRYDELAGYGSYCNMQVDIDRADEHIRRIQQGMPERGFWLAGEHAAPIEERGTVGGAWMSGKMTAEKILTKYGRIQET